MKYQMVNEELQIASCSIADLTAKQAQQFTEQWGEDASLGTLTLFYEPSNGLLVLNRDNKHYNKYKDIAECYLSGNDKQRKELRNKAPESMQETLQVLETCANSVFAKKEIFRARNNFIRDETSRKVVEEIIRNYDPYVIGMMAFRYGMMQGKRAERARKKKGSVSK